MEAEENIYIDHTEAEANLQTIQIKARTKHRKP